VALPVVLEVPDTQVEACAVLALRVVLAVADTQLEVFEVGVLGLALELKPANGRHRISRVSLGRGELHMPL
jgi:hypothetical protein